MLESLIPYGYIAYNGKQLSDYWVDKYNAEVERFNGFIRDGIKPPESLLNSKHKTFCMACQFS